MVQRLPWFLLAAGCVAEPSAPESLPHAVVGAPAWCAAGVAARVAGQGVDHLTIQDAIDAAPPGATILICPGTYSSGELRFTTDMEFRGVTGRAADVVLDGQYSNSLLRFRGAYFDRIVLRDITFTRSQDPTFGYSVVTIQDANVGSSTVLIDGCVFTDNHEDPVQGGQVLSVTASQIGIRDTMFVGNSGIAASLTVNDGGSLLVDNVTCRETADIMSLCMTVGNQAQRTQTQRWTFRNLNIVDNVSLDSSLDLTVRGDVDLELRIEDSYFARNTALEASTFDISAINSALLRTSISGTVFEDNIAGDRAMLSISTTPNQPWQQTTIKDSVFYRNQADDGYHGVGQRPLLNVNSALTGVWNVDFGTGPDTNVVSVELPACYQDVGIVAGPRWLTSPWCPP